jgi:hypothetical protein
LFQTATEDLAAVVLSFDVLLPADVEVRQTLLPWLIVEMMCKLGGVSAKSHERTLHGPETKDIIVSQVIIKTNLSQLYTLI